MRKIGISLAPALLLDQPVAADGKLRAEFGGLDNLLDWLGQAGVASVELRSVAAGFQPEQLLRISQLLDSYGLDLTVHGSMPEAVPDLAAAGRFFRPYQLLLEKRQQKPLIIVLHTLRDSVKLTVASLQNLLAYAVKNDLAVQLALENSRDKEGYFVGVSCRGIADIINQTSRDQLGGCWDMGHFYYNVLHDTAEGRALDHDPQALPPADFLRGLIHTHIHGLEEAMTHFPPQVGLNLPLANYVTALKEAAYQGLYNLELEFDRISEKMSPRLGLEQAVLALRSV